MQYYWVTTQSEFATDLVFKSRQHLTEFFPVCWSTAPCASRLETSWVFWGGSGTGSSRAK